jgi:hypothetical protein
LLKVLAVLGAVWVVVVGVLVYLVDTTAVASARARSDSTSLLDSVRTHANAAQAALAALPQFDASGTSPDFAGAKHTADQYASQLAGDRTTVQADEVRLRADRDRLLEQASSVLALPYRPSLDHERLRAEGMLSALQAEDTALQIEADQMHTVSLIFDAENDFATLLIDHVEKQDVAGALALFPGLDGKLQAASQAAAGANTAPQARKLVGDLQKLSTDVGALLQAERRLDLGTALALGSKVQADVAVVEAFDSQGLDSYEQTLLQPYLDRFDSGVRAAGFTTASNQA